MVVVMSRVYFGSYREFGDIEGFTVMDLRNHSSLSDDHGDVSLWGSW